MANSPSTASYDKEVERRNKKIEQNNEKIQKILDANKKLKDENSETTRKKNTHLKIMLGGVITKYLKSAGIEVTDETVADLDAFISQQENNKKRGTSEPGHFFTSFMQKQVEHRIQLEENKAKAEAKEAKEKEAEIKSETENQETNQTNQSDSDISDSDTSDYDIMYDTMPDAVPTQPKKTQHKKATVKPETQSKK